MNIEELNEIIHNRNCAQITYCYYDTDKKLVARDGYPKTVEPIHLMWSNGYYYLRTPSFYEFESEYTVLNDGSILSSSLGNTGIAPALWIKIK